MGTRYVGRPATSNKGKIVGVRLPEQQREKLDSLSSKYNMTLSELIREAITIWLNMNTKGGA